MNPTSIPDEEIWPGTVRYVAMPPDGDMTGDSGIAPVEMLKGLEEYHDVPFQAVRFVATPDEVERLASGEPIWLIYFMPMPIPIALEFKDIILTPEFSDDPEVRNIPIRKKVDGEWKVVLLNRQEWEQWREEQDAGQPPAPPS